MHALMLTSIPMGSETGAISLPVVGGAVGSIAVISGIIAYLYAKVYAPEMALRRTHELEKLRMRVQISENTRETAKATAQTSSSIETASSGLLRCAEILERALHTAQGGRGVSANPNKD